MNDIEARNKVRILLSSTTRNIFLNSWTHDNIIDIIYANFNIIFVYKLCDRAGITKYNSYLLNL